MPEHAAKIFVDGQSLDDRGHVEHTADKHNGWPFNAVLEVLRCHDLQAQQNAHGRDGHNRGVNAVPEFGHPHGKGAEHNDKHCAFVAAHGAELGQLLLAVALGQRNRGAWAVHDHDGNCQRGKADNAPGQGPEQPVHPGDGIVGGGQGTDHDIVAERAAQKHVPHKYKTAITRTHQARCGGAFALNAERIADSQRNGRGKGGLCVHDGHKGANDRARCQQTQHLAVEGRWKEAENPKGYAFEKPGFARDGAKAKRAHHDPPASRRKAVKGHLEAHALGSCPERAHHESGDIFGYDLGYPPEHGPHHNAQGNHGLPVEAVGWGHQGNGNAQNDRENCNNLLQANNIFGTQTHRTSNG